VLGVLLEVEEEASWGMALSELSLASLLGYWLVWRWELSWVSLMGRSLVSLMVHSLASE
jgi:hypothetical protein